MWVRNTKEAGKEDRLPHPVQYTIGGKMNCPSCGSDSIKKNGFSLSLIAPKQRYKCLECGRRFTDDDLDEDRFPAVLLMDIETLPIKAYVWDVWGVDVRKEQIIEDWCVLCWSAKWLDDDRMITDCVTPAEAAKRNDKRVCQSMWRLFDDADVIIAQNGKKFDVPKLNTRWWKHNISRPSSYKIIDTLDAARRTFGMTYNSLDYLATYLGIGRKIKTDFELWANCDRGDKDALEKMQEYNENDVTLLENVYLKMRGWIPNHPNFTAYDKVKDVCPVCFDSNIKNIGLYTATVRQYKEWRCGKCGSLWHSTRCEKD
jgi:transposase-like protein